MLAMMILDLDGFDLHHQEGRRHLTYKKNQLKLLLKLRSLLSFQTCKTGRIFPFIKGSQSIAMKH